MVAAQHDALASNDPRPVAQVEAESGGVWDGVLFVIDSSPDGSRRPGGDLSRAGRRWVLGRVANLPRLVGKARLRPSRG